MDPQEVSLSPLDEKRFGIRSARANVPDAGTVPQVMRFCRENDVVFLIARSAAKDLACAQALERAGARLMDTLVYYARDLAKTEIPADTGKVPVRPVRPDEVDAVARVAGDCFKGYFGHYHADPRLDRARCDETYVDWATRSCLSREVAQEVLVADSGGKVVGMATLRVSSPEEGEGVLFGVAPEAQGQGVYRSFMIAGMNWCRARGTKRMVVSTQIANLAVQKVWTRLGFEPSNAYHTFHKWFDEPA